MRETTLRHAAVVAGLLGLIAIAVVASEGSAQPVSAPPPPRLAGLDSVAVAVAPTLPASVLDSLLPDGASVSNQLAPGRFVVGLDLPARTPGTLLDFTRGMVESIDEVLLAGPLAYMATSTVPILVTGSLIILFDAAASESDIAHMESTLDLGMALVSPHLPTLRLYRVPSTVRDLSGFMATVGGHDIVEVAELDVAPALPPSGGHGSLPTVSQWHAGMIDLPAAWVTTEGAARIKIAVIETYGFDVSHPHLRPNLWENPLEALAPTDGVDNDLNGLVDDVHGWSYALYCDETTTPELETCGTDFTKSGATAHGTAVAGLAGAHSGPEGMSGVCPACTLMLLEVGGGTWGRTNAVLYAQSMGASIINASWGPVPRSASLSLEFALEKAAIYGRDGLGIPVVMAATNLDEDVCTGVNEGYQALDQIISVAASNELDLGVPGKGHGSCLDLIAPGYHTSSSQGVSTLDETGAPGYNTDLDICSSDYANLDYTECFSGTSASAPIVAGVIGLMLTVNPSLTAPEVRELLIATAEKVDCVNANYSGAPVPPADCTAVDPDPNWASDTHGFGRVDAVAAVQAATPPCECEEGLSPATIFGVITFIIIIMILLRDVILPRPPKPSFGASPTNPQ